LAAAKTYYARDTNLKNGENTQDDALEARYTIRYTRNHALNQNLATDIPAEPFRAG
jgi:hypothetical protein